MGTFSIGNITPHVTTVAGAKGAAAVLIDIIDNVSSSSLQPGPIQIRLCCRRIELEA